jgi:hypothetical protein
MEFDDHPSHMDDNLASLFLFACHFQNSIFLQLLAKVKGFDELLSNNTYSHACRVHNTWDFVDAGSLPISIFMNFGTPFFPIQ